MSSQVMENLLAREKRAGRLDGGIRELIKAGLTLSAEKAGIAEGDAEVAVGRNGEIWKGRLSVAPEGITPLVVYVTARLTGDGYGTVFIDQHSRRNATKSVVFNVGESGKIADIGTVVEKFGADVFGVLEKKSKSVFDLFEPCG